MNRPALIWHLAVKDLRYQRGLVALLWLLALLLPIAARYIGPGSLCTDAFLIGPRYLFVFVCIVITLRAIQLDHPGRGIHFLTTRPINWPSLLASKFLFACVFLLIPNWMATLGPMFAIGMHFSCLDAVLFLIEGTISAAALLAVTAAPALFLRKLISAVMTIIGAVIVTGIGLIFYIGHEIFGEPFTAKPPAPSDQLEHCRGLIFEFGLAFTGLAVALFCYRKRPVRQSLLVLGSGFFVCVLLASYWPIDFSLIFSDRAPDLAPALRDKIKFHIELPPAHPVNLASDGNVDVRGGLSGLQAPYFYVQTGGNAELTLRSGRKLASSDMSHPWRLDLLEEAGARGDSLQADLMGFIPVPRQSRPWHDETFDAFHEAYYSVKGRYRDEELRGVSIKGMATFSVGRAFLLGDFPLHDRRMVLNLPRRRYTLRQVKAGPEGISVQISREFMPLTLRGDDPDQNSWENLPCILINRRKREYLIVVNDDRDSGCLETLHLERPDEAMGPIPADWINDAEIVFFASEPCGQISFPYEIPSIDLIQ